MLGALNRSLENYAFRALLFTKNATGVAWKSYGRGAGAGAGELLQFDLQIGQFTTRNSTGMKLRQVDRRN
jgi:hypothetical protein